MLNCLVVALGGGIGASLRYLIGLIPIKEPFTFPVKTLLINLLGCFVVGLIAAFAVKNSTLSSKTVLFIKTGLFGIAILYVSLSVVVGVGLAFAGQVVVGK